MAGDIGWKSVELQLEALIPGILLAWAIGEISYEKWPDAFSMSLAHGDFVSAALFVSASYVVGLVSSILARSLVDPLSERGPRAWVFNRYAHAPLTEIVETCRQLDYQRFEADLKAELAKRRNKEVGEWNAVYRSYLRITSGRHEVDRRRSQGRFIRNLVFVGALAPVALTELSRGSVALSVLAVVVVLALYAYSEYAIFAEAFDIAAHSKKANT